MKKTNRYVSAAEKRFFKLMREAKQKRLTKEQQEEIAYLQKAAFEYGLSHSYSNHYLWEQLSRAEKVINGEAA